MRNATIIYIGGFILPDKNAAAQRVMGIAKGYKDLGYNVVFIDTQNDIDKESILETMREVNEFTVYSVPYPSNVLHWTRHLVSC